MKRNHSRLYPQSILLILCLSLSIAYYELSFGNERILPHHTLIITLHPETHSLTAEDTITFHDPNTLPNLIELTLNRNLVIDDIRLNGSLISLQEINEEQRPKEEGHRLLIPLPSSQGTSSSPSITVRYHGMIDDQPKGTVGLRFIKPDKTTGYIGPEGVYLTSETQWYPTISKTLATFHVRSTVPSGWETVTQGKETARVVSQDHTTSAWSIPSPSEALTLAANRFVKQAREWNGITLATYLFPEDAKLAEQYLNATAKYLDLYTKLLGPYPFSKFAVVENFFPSGIGIPSYTLLGNRIIKRGYTQPYSLGHEIVHSWFGNSVFNQFSEGNWVEGLTTYLSNYYYEELNASTETALKNRQHMIYEYNLYATQSDEYPVKQFHHKETRIDNAIGYQKTAMIFHMLRQEVGETNFFDGIRTLVKEWTGKHADWSTIQQIFSKGTGKDLIWFFEQWVERSGSPSITIGKTVVEEDPHHPGQFFVNVKLAQQKPHYRLRLPAVLHLANGKTHRTFITMHDHEQTVRLSSPARPTRLVIDPNFAVLQRLTRGQIPPMLNTWVTDPNQSVQLDKSLAKKEQEAYQPILHRLRSQRSGTVSDDHKQATLPNASLLLLGDPLNNRLARQGLAACNDDVDIGDNWMTIQGEKFEGDDIAWLVSCPHPNNPDHVVTIFHGFSPSAISHVARLLFFYGWDSYLVFQNGKVISRGLFEPSIRNLEVSLNTA